MASYYYTKSKKKNVKGVVRITGLLISLSGFLLTAYIFFPLISWNIYFAPVFASEAVAIPIPTQRLVSKDTVSSLIANSINTLSGVDYTDAQNWFPGFKVANGSQIVRSVPSYTLSVPSLGIANAQVSTVNNDLSKHLVNYDGTAIPPEKGNAVIFGHSTLPQLFDPKNYKAIFATAYKLQNGDVIEATVSGVTYTYKIYSITVVDADDTSIFTQDYSQQTLTIVTCTPPGTTWKRLIIRAKLQSI